MVWEDFTGVMIDHEKNNYSWKSRLFLSFLVKRPG